MGKIKQPYLIRMKAQAPFALAGLWAHWEGLIEGMPREIESFTIVATQANELTRSIQDRMPVILPEAAWQHWLDPDTPLDVLKARGRLLCFMAGIVSGVPVAAKCVGGIYAHLN